MNSIRLWLSSEGQIWASFREYLISTDRPRQKTCLKTDLGWTRDFYLFSLSLGTNKVKSRGWVGILNKSGKSNNCNNSSAKCCRLAGILGTSRLSCALCFQFGSAQLTQWFFKSFEKKCFGSRYPDVILSPHFRNCVFFFFGKWFFLL